MINIEKAFSSAILSNFKFLTRPHLRRQEEKTTLRSMTFYRNDVINYINGLGIKISTFDHSAVYTVEESKQLRGELPGGHSKNLFLKDKKGRLWLLVVREDQEVDLKNLRKIIGSAQLSFGKPELLMEALGLKPGSVTPFGVINDTKNRVTVVLDQKLMEYDILNFHPMTNTATSQISPDGLLEFLQNLDHNPIVVEL